VLAAGPRVFDSQGDPLSIPKLAPMSAVGMTAENVAVPESDPVFSEVQLLPATLKSFKRGHRISNELARHSVLAIATVMGQAIVERTALEIDAAFLTGTGATNTITGFTSMAGTSGVTLGASVVPTIDNLLDAQGSLQVPGAQAGGKIILADMNQVAVGRDTAPGLGVFTETFADSDQLHLRVVARYDIKPLDAAGIYIITPRDGREARREGARQDGRGAAPGRCHPVRHRPRPAGLHRLRPAVAGD
jgi:hypothetical protein